jgi:transposase InsO family protein
MMSVLISFLATLPGVVRSRAVLHLEVLALRHQLQVLQRSRPHRLRLATMDRWLWTWLAHWSGWRAVLVIVKPETVIAWHRKGFRLFWTWKSRRRGGRPPVLPNIRTLIRTMSRDNPLWGAPRIHGELLKLGVDVSQATVAKYIGRRDTKPPSQAWRTFLANHLQQLAAADFFVVPTATCRLMFVLVILAHERRRIVHVAVTDHPTAAWTAQQLREAFPWNEAPRYLVHDRDSAFHAWTTTAAAVGIEEVLTAPRSPWQNAYAERLIGSIRRECLDHIVVVNARGLRRVLRAYVEYYLKSRTHLSLDKDAPMSRPVATPTNGEIVAIPHLGGLHHHYERRAA